MEQLSKRPRDVKEAAIEDIASSVESLSRTLASFSDTQKCLLRANKIVVSYLRASEKSRKEVDEDESNESFSSSDE